MGKELITSGDAFVGWELLSLFRRKKPQLQAAAQIAARAKAGDPKARAILARARFTAIAKRFHAHPINTASNWANHAQSFVEAVNRGDKRAADEEQRHVDWLTKMWVRKHAREFGSLAEFAQKERLWTATNTKEMLEAVKKYPQLKANQAKPGVAGDSFVGTVMGGLCGTGCYRKGLE